MKRGMFKFVVVRQGSDPPSLVIASHRPFAVVCGVDNIATYAAPWRGQRQGKGNVPKVPYVAAVCPARPVSSSDSTSSSFENQVDHEGYLD